MRPNAIDTYSCGINESHPRSTISHCLTQLIPEYVTDIEILTGTIIETNSFNCETDNFTVYGQRDLTTIIQTELESGCLSLFSVSTGILSVRDLVLVHNSAHANNRASRLFEITGAGEMLISGLNISAGNGQSSEAAFSTELINVQNGMFQMEHVNWAKTISTTSLFSLSSTNEITLTLSECTFDGIERTTSGAAVMSFSSDKINIDLNSSTFEGCGSSSSENGGSMMLFAGNGNEVKVNGGSFDGCFSSLDTLDKVRGYDNGNNSVAIPLCIYLLHTPEEIYVSNSEASYHSYCGIVQFPCLTLKHSVIRQTGTKKVTVSGMIMMSDELTFAGQKHEIRGSNDQSGWTVSDSTSSFNSAMITASVETELSKLIFSLPSSLSHSTFISSSSLLTLSHCSLSLQMHSSEMEFLFLSIESGTLVIDSFSASSISLRENTLISLIGSSTNSETMNTKWLNMTKCTFTEIERVTGSGGYEKTGFGGGMALKLIDDYSSFVISSPVFEADKPNTAKYGNDHFVESLNLTKSITNTSLPFVPENLDDITLDSMRGFDGNDSTNAIPLIYLWLSLGAQIFIGGDGKDVCTCGLSDYPCLSIDCCLDRLPEGNERKINIIGKGILQKSVDVSGLSMCSNNEEMCSLECVSSLEEAEGAAMKISGITKFEFINFMIPSSFTGGVNYLMHVDSSDGLLTLKDCSFTKNEEAEKKKPILG
ncbi:uncharacterized protein MONOS_14268 [Monocercomonoides exilis]|uniref:uncharacterized protein n=1 Tax=Monocercomonoides exilis TaxID=2049356 RepID=UPI00355AACF0|nr:hypothetical protein MONOS_14268 [Monocercomonoides exilis]|eukprot:MONOS_14268.1-p1 / transcript=MONOS_14268.1 / gene=MONOS_14268 / organism=Monocercomonoides_exilis_PA203 / gene_product=unspecified product / transcript_product=unspecified product / location=Mono_scaffold00968:2267-4759(+) / protein_length=709 / sequence_SO=supercontig / SO=protein_coding / is_pseudo=false